MSWQMVVLGCAGLALAAVAFLTGHDTAGLTLGTSTLTGLVGHAMPRVGQ